MDQLRSQDVVMKNEAAVRDNTLRPQKFVDEYEMARSGKYALNTFSEEKRQAIKEAALGGIFNRDPRVRLTSIHFLRRLGPEESMLDAVIRARSIAAGVSPEQGDTETDDHLNAFIDTNLYERLDGPGTNPDYLPEARNRYRGVLDDAKLKDEDNTLILEILHPAYTIENNEYQIGLRTKLDKEKQAHANGLVPYFGLYQLKSPGEELDKLYRFIQRRRLVRAIKRGDVNAITRMSRTDFGILSEFIDDEYAARVPFVSYHTKAQDRSARTALPSRYGEDHRSSAASGGVLIRPGRQRIPDYRLKMA
jgi:hypothetical protein